MKAGSTTEAALQGIDKASVGDMPYYMANEIAEAVSQGLTLYQTLYSSAE